MSAFKVSGPVLPDGEPRELYVVDGRVTYERQAGADTVAEGWIVPGLVDAHCHLGLDDFGATTDEETEQQALDDRDGGALLIRDAGSAADTRWVQSRDDLPRLIRCGRHIGRTKRYIRNYAHEVEPLDLPGYAAQEARHGDGWIKLVGDWIDRDEGDLAPSFPAEAFAAAIDAAHAEGAKVTAHCFGPGVLPGLIRAGIDCIEHGTGLSEDLVDEMVARGTALVPTIMQLDLIPEHAAAGAALPRLRRDHARPARSDAGHDHGGVRGGRADLRRLGRGRHQPPRQHRRRGGSAPPDRDPRPRRARGGQLAGTRMARPRRARGGRPGRPRGVPADPTADLSVLRRPSRVVLRGRVVA